MTREEAVEALTERMARLAREWACESIEQWTDLDETARDYFRELGGVVMAEVLSARVESDCPTCKGQKISPAIHDWGTGGPDPMCPDCKGSGKSYGPLLVTVATMEHSP